MSTVDSTESADVNDAAEPVGVARLRAAQEAVANLQQDAAVESPLIVQPGDVVHAVSTGLSIHRNSSLWGGTPPLTLTRGDSFVVTEEMIEAAKDRHGRPGWPSLVNDPERQLARWGRIHLAPGPTPEGMRPWTHGDADWAEQREQARQAAWKEPGPERRAAALQRVTEIYGPAPTTSSVHAIYKTDRAHDEQQARIAASAASGTPNMGPSR